MKTYTVTAGTPLHCNRNDCGATFPAPTDLERTAFAGSRAARTTTMVVCPVCQRPDGQWVHAADVTPAFEGGFDARQRQAMAWRLAN